MFFVCFVFFKQKTAYEMRISDWSSDVCSSDLQIVIDDDGVHAVVAEPLAHRARRVGRHELHRRRVGSGRGHDDGVVDRAVFFERADDVRDAGALLPDRDVDAVELLFLVARSEEHTSELQSLMRISYAVFCLKKKKTKQ